MKRALQAILIAGEQAKNDVLNGTKIITIREGHRDYTNGPVLIGCHILNWATMKNIVRVELTTLKNVSLDDIMKDGFVDHNNALNQLRKFYPNMTMDSEVSVVEWGRI